MPTYEYRCKSCAVEFEEVQSINADPVKTCPECGKDTVQRMISSGNFVLKGGGWYADGYSSSGKDE